MKWRNVRYIVLGCSVLAGMALLAQPVYAERFESPNFIIDASDFGHAIAGDMSSTNYRLTAAGGDAVIGDGAGGSFLLGEGYIAQLEQAIQLHVQPSGLAAYYPMDENVGTRVHDNSTHENNSQGQTTATWTDGKINRALYFDGSAEVTVPDNASLDLADNFSVMAWVNPGVTSQAASGVVSKTNGGASNYLLGVTDTSNQARFVVNCPGQVELTGSTGLTDTNTWYHIAAVKDGTAVKLFVNGQIEDSATCGSATATTTSTPLLLGATTASNGQYNGTIDEAKVFSRAFFDKEMENEYEATNAGTPASLTFPNITPGTSQTVGADVVVQTDGPSYELAVAQNGDMTNGTDTIPAVSGTIASPEAWDEGTTKGLGFTLTGGNISIPGTWGSSPNFNYAAVPDASTAFLVRSGFTGGEKDILEMQYRLDVSTDQPAGEYQNTVTYTGVVVP